jgi:queuine tRNA-ribosyltransferase
VPKTANKQSNKPTSTEPQTRASADFPNTFSFTLEKTRGRARVGYFDTPHGRVHTPVYMPVGTQATVKALDSLDVENTQAEIILANTYHLYLRPGMEVLQQYGGVQDFMRWSKPMLTDSGGFQVFSLAKESEAVKIKPGGVEFTSFLDGSKHFFSPEKAIEIQRTIGADIIMAFDECTPDLAPLEYAREALDRTHRWARQCKEAWDQVDHLSKYGRYQALFGIIQGAMIESLRKESAQTIIDLDFDGIAVGGETIGYNMAGTAQVMDWIEGLLPEDKPRYAMGLGLNPQDLVSAVNMGFDMFDCVAPTRLARNGTLYVGELADLNPHGELVFVGETGSQEEKGRITIGASQFRTDQKVIQPGCDCETCKAGYSRAYLQHLYKTKELAYYRLASIHNVRFMIRLMESARHMLFR